MGMGWDAGTGTGTGVGTVIGMRSVPVQWVVMNLPDVCFTHTVALPLVPCEKQPASCGVE